MKSSQKEQHPQPNFKTKIALTIAAIAYGNCLYLITQPDLSPPEVQLLEASIVILTASTQKLLEEDDKR
jgi:hypothetical protein